MSSSAEILAPSDGAQLRQRLQPSSSSGESLNFQDACQRVRELNADPENKKTYGRTPDNTVFVVPTTHDMVSQLLDPRQPKNLSDGLVLAILALHILLAWKLPQHLKQPVFAAIFVFWRACYNVGIGYLLSVQSSRRLLETWARKWKLFEKPETGANPRPWLYRLLKRELEAKIPDDYKFEDAPIEYNTWLVFRRVVDLILMCDFTSYCLFAVVCAHWPADESWWFRAGRLVFGLVLFGFNVWVKLDAHRVVKDYAWYWGDFFYLIDQELTFDGVFEMAPHPMYSIGYAGYYGISIWAASYNVLFISILAHLAQFAFLVVVESPHIEKTYNPPPPRKRVSTDTAEPLKPGMDGWVSVPGSKDALVPVHNMLGLKNFDVFRTVDYALVLILVYLLAFTVATPSTPLYQAIFVGQALTWRLWYSVGLGIILTRQSQDKMFTRHFLKFGESVEESWRQWKSMYHISLVLCHVSFIAACWKMSSLPENWSYGWTSLRIVLGLALIALHAWTSTSIYESLGEFGWFYGDFFFENRGKLTYGSIYRYLNNPERIIGTAGLWGAALITWSRTIFVLALVGHLLALGFIHYVEKPHMQKIYGGSLRDEAGLTKFIKRALPEPVKGLQMSVDKVIDDTTHVVDEIIEAARLRLAGGSSSIARDFTSLLKVPTRLTISRISPDLAGLNPKDYSLSVEGTPLPTDSEWTSDKEGVTARVPKAVKTKVYEYGAPLIVKWTVPENHGKKDWVGLYRVIDNRSREATEVSSLARWVPTRRGSYDSARDIGILESDKPLQTDESSDVKLVRGEMIFEGDKLWWTEGAFEFRYHHDGSHTVMAISEPFEVRIPKFDAHDEATAGPVDSYTSASYQDAVAAKLLPIVWNCLDRDPDIAPNTVDEPFGAHVERNGKYTKRVVYAIGHMFGVEFAPEVVLADGNVKKLAWRICNAKQVLAPYSMSPSRGPTTPVTDKFPDELKD